GTSHGVPAAVVSTARSGGLLDRPAEAVAGGIHGPGEELAPPAVLVLARFPLGAVVAALARHVRLLRVLEGATHLRRGRVDRHLRLAVQGLGGAGLRAGQREDATRGAEARPQDLERPPAIEAGCLVVVSVHV